MKNQNQEQLQKEWDKKLKSELNNKFKPKKKTSNREKRCAGVTHKMVATAIRIAKKEGEKIPEHLFKDGLAMMRYIYMGQKKQQGKSIRPEKPKNSEIIELKKQLARLSVDPSTLRPEMFENNHEVNIMTKFLIHKTKSHSDFFWKSERAKFTAKYKRTPEQFYDVEI